MRYSKIILLATFFLFSSLLFAQTTQEIKVPLSNPGEDGRLQLGVINGSIKVKGYSGNKVIIKVTTNSKENGNQSSSKNGLRRISSNSAGFTAEEIDNLVVVKPSFSSSPTNFDIQVPRNFSLQLSTINDGDISVENVKGEFEVTNTNGSITMENVSGSVIADALNDDIIVTFDDITADAPMAFSSLNGNVDITFPKALNANIVANSDNGEVFTDFDLKITKAEPKITSRNKSGVYKVKSEKGVLGMINNGGAKFTFKTMNGDIIIRAKK